MSFHDDPSTSISKSSNTSTLAYNRCDFQNALQALLDESHLGAEEEITIIKRDENREDRQITYLSTRRGKIETIKSRLPDHEYEACVVRLDDDLTFHVVTAPSDYFSPSEGLCYGENQVEKAAEERWG